MQIDKIKGQIHNVPDHIHKKITDTSKTLLALLSFLKENDEKLTINTVKKLLNAALFMNKNNILGFMAYITINKDTIDKSHQPNK